MLNDETTTPESPAESTPESTGTDAPATTPAAGLDLGGGDAAAAAVAAPPATETAVIRGRRSPDGKWWTGTGRRKSAVARVRLCPGSGEFTINKRPLAEFFPSERDRADVQSVLKITGTEGRLDVHAAVRGGGTTGQCGAIVLGIGRALSAYDNALVGQLRENGFLTRDPREVERKKYGQAGARRRFQFSKR